MDWVSLVGWFLIGACAVYLFLYHLALRHYIKQNNVWWKAYRDRQIKEARRSMAFIRDWLKQEIPLQRSEHKRRAYQMLKEAIDFTGTWNIDDDMYCRFLVIFDDVREGKFEGDDDPDTVIHLQMDLDFIRDQLTGAKFVTASRTQVN